MTLILGGFIFGIPTFTNIFSNGYMFGVIFAVYIKAFRIDQFLLLILPHGIFEIPAIIIAGAAGFKIPYEIVRYLAGKKETILTKEDIKEYLTFALISIILIVIAAWIEANVTLKIAEAMLNSTNGFNR
ncbi:stage II sporulation protein M [Geoglobus acetivorans]